MRRASHCVAGLLLLVVAGCGDEQPASPAFAPCPSDPPAAIEPDNLPGWVPLPDQVGWHSATRIDVFEVVEGTSDASVEALHESFTAGLEAVGADTLFDEVEALDSEVTARHDGHLVFVIIQAECEGRRKVKVSVRPDTLSPEATRTGGRQGRAGGGAAPS